MFRNRQPLRIIPVTAHIITQQKKEAYKIQQIKNKKTNQLSQTRHFITNIQPPDPNNFTLIILAIGIYLSLYK